MRKSFRVHPDTHRIVKFWPNNPPRRGEYVLVDDVRCKVVRAKVVWDGPRWKIRHVRVKVA